jgi:hypothetical protein
MITSHGMPPSEHTRTRTSAALGCRTLQPCRAARELSAPTSFASKCCIMCEALLPAAHRRGTVDGRIAYDSRERAIWRRWLLSAGLRSEHGLKNKRVDPFFLRFMQPHDGFIVFTAIQLHGSRRALFACCDVPQTPRATSTPTAGLPWQLSGGGGGGGGMMLTTTVMMMASGGVVEALFKNRAENML